jgi:hypothetical protein
VQNVRQRLHFVDLRQIEQAETVIVVCQGSDPRLSVCQSNLGESHERESHLSAKSSTGN